MFSGGFDGGQWVGGGGHVTGISGGDSSVIGMFIRFWFGGGVLSPGWGAVGAPGGGGVFHFARCVLQGFQGFWLFGFGF